MKIGNRIIFDQSGEIITQLGEMEGDVLPRAEIVKLDYIDLEFGAVDYSKHRIIGVNIETKQPILEEILMPKAPGQEQIEELENQLLLMSDALI